MTTKMAALIMTCDLPTSSYSAHSCPFVAQLQRVQLAVSLAIRNGEDVSSSPDSPSFGSPFLLRSCFEDLRKLLQSCRARVVTNKMRPLRPQRTVS